LRALQRLWHIKFNKNQAS